MNVKIFAVLAVVAVGVVGVLSTALRRPTVRRGVSVTVIAPRDFHDSGPVATRRVPVRAVARSKRPTQRSFASPGSKTTIGPHPLVRPLNRPLPSRKPKTVKTKPGRRKPQQRPAQGHEPLNPPAPPAKQCPPVNVTVPAPITVGVGPVGVNCP